MKIRRFGIVFIVVFVLLIGAIQAHAFTIRRSGSRIMFTPQLSTTALSLAGIKSDFFIGSNIVETILAGSSSGTTSAKDVVYNYFAPGSIESGCSVFIQDSGNTPVYSAVNPSIATVASNGSTTYVSAGTAYFNVRLGRRTKTIPCVFSRTSNVPSYTFNNSVSTSTIRNMKDQVDTRISGLTPYSTTFNLYSAINDTTHVYTRNTNLFAADVDLTCIPTLNGAINSAQTMGVLVAPDIMIQANHSHPAGVTYFTKNDNTTISRTITSGTRIGVTDIWVSKLDSDVPSGITPCKVFSSTAFTNSISTTSLLYVQPPVVFTNQSRQLRIGKINYSSYGGFPYDVPIISGSGDYSGWYSTPCCGDSGSPAFALVNNQAIVIGTWYSAFSVPNLSNYISSINTAMTSLGSPYSLSTVDLSGFQTF